MGWCGSDIGSSRAPILETSLGRVAPEDEVYAGALEQIRLQLLRHARRVICDDDGYVTRLHHLEQELDRVVLLHDRCRPIGGGAALPPPLRDEPIDGTRPPAAAIDPVPPAGDGVQPRGKAAELP